MCTIHLSFLLYPVIRIVPIVLKPSSHYSCLSPLECKLSKGGIFVCFNSYKKRWTKYLPQDIFVHLLPEVTRFCWHRSVVGPLDILDRCILTIIFVLSVCPVQRVSVLGWWWLWQYTLPTRHNLHNYIVEIGSMCKNQEMTQDLIKFSAKLYSRNW